MPHINKTLFPGHDPPYLYVGNVHRTLDCGLGKHHTVISNLDPSTTVSFSHLFTRGQEFKMICEIVTGLKYPSTFMRPNPSRVDVYVVVVDWFLQRLTVSVSGNACSLLFNGFAFIC